METISQSVPGQRKLWVRALLMLMMAAAFQLAATVLVFVALLQLVLHVAQGGPNARLAPVATGIGAYLAQIAGFVGFATELAPFPFADWPEGAA